MFSGSGPNRFGFPPTHQRRRRSVEQLELIPCIGIVKEITYNIVILSVQSCVQTTSKQQHLIGYILHGFKMFLLFCFALLSSLFVTGAECGPTGVRQRREHGADPLGPDAFFLHPPEARKRIQFVLLDVIPSESVGK